VRGRLSSRESAFRLGRNLPTMPSIMGGWAAQMGNVGQMYLQKKGDP
jgi:hypothetical protein